MTKGCNCDMLRVILICFTVSGNVIKRTSTVNTRILNPKLLNSMLYRKTRLLTIGPMISCSQAKLINSKIDTYHWPINVIDMLFMSFVDPLA